MCAKCDHSTRLRVGAASRCVHACWACCVHTYWAGRLTGVPAPPQARRQVTLPTDSIDTVELLEVEVPAACTAEINAELGWVDGRERSRVPSAVCVAQSARRRRLSVATSTVHVPDRDVPQNCEAVLRATQAHQPPYLVVPLSYHCMFGGSATPATPINVSIRSPAPLVVRTVRRPASEVGRLLVARTCKLSTHVTEGEGGQQRVLGAYEPNGSIAYVAVNHHPTKALKVVLDARGSTNMCSSRAGGLMVIADVVLPKTAALLLVLVRTDRSKAAQVESPFKMSSHPVDTAPAHYFSAAARDPLLGPHDALHAAFPTSELTL